MKRLRMVALLAAALLGMTMGTAYADHTSELQIDVDSVHLEKDGSALIRVRAKCSPGPYADQYNIQPVVILAGDIAYGTVASGGSGLCTGKWQRYAIVRAHVEGQPLLVKGIEASVLVYYQLYPEGYENCEGSQCSVYEPGSHGETVRVR